MDVEQVIQAIKGLSPEDKLRVEEALGAAKQNGTGESDQAHLASERVRLFDELMAKMPALPEPRVDPSRESIYE